MSKMALYSSRIRHLHFSKKYLVDLDTARVHETLPPGILFPRLQNLVWYTGYETEVLFVMRTMGDALHELLAQRSTLMLLSLIEKPFSLTQLDMTLPPDIDPPASVALLAVLRKAKNLRTLKVPCEEDEEIAPLWGAFADLPFLEQRTISTIRLFNGQSYEHVTFAALTTLNINFKATVAASTTLFRASRFPCLQTLRIHMETQEVPSESDMIAMSTAIATSCTNSPLSALSIDSETFSRNIPQNWEGFIGPRAFRPFLQLKNIRGLELRFPQWFLDLDDTLILDMLHAWPQLKIISLNPTLRCTISEERTGSRVTYRILESLHMFCPQLRFFGALFNKNPAFPSPTASPASAEHRNLVALDVGTSSLEFDQVPDVAAYLSGLFPALERIEHASPSDNTSEMGDRWKLVSILVPKMAQVRADERRYSALSGDCLPVKVEAPGQLTVRRAMQSIVLI